MRPIVRFRRILVEGEFLPAGRLEVFLLVVSDMQTAFPLAHWSPYSRTWQAAAECYELLGWRRGDLDVVKEPAEYGDYQEVRLPGLTPSVWQLAVSRAKEFRRAGAAWQGVKGWEDCPGGLPPAPGDPDASNPASQRP
jgi:hypothetical protein